MTARLAWSRQDGLSRYSAPDGDSWLIIADTGSPRLPWVLNRYQDGVWTRLGSYPLLADAKEAAELTSPQAR